jgi:hypothetical protein
MSSFPTIQACPSVPRELLDTLSQTYSGVSPTPSSIDPTNSIRHLQAEPGLHTRTRSTVQGSLIHQSLVKNKTGMSLYPLIKSWIDSMGKCSSAMRRHIESVSKDNMEEFKFGSPVNLHKRKPAQLKALTTEKTVPKASLFLVHPTNFNHHTSWQEAKL